MLFDIDWQGAQQLSEKMRADIVSIFILPPSMTELKSRLQRRAEDSAATIETRLDNARIEIEHWREYDYVVINDDLDRAFASVKSIVTAERCAATAALACSISCRACSTRKTDEAPLSLLFRDRTGKSRERSRPHSPAPRIPRR